MHPIVFPLAAAFCWSVNYLLVERTMRSISPATYWFICALVQLPLAGLLLWRDRREDSALSLAGLDWGPVCLLVGSTIAVGCAAEYLSIQGISRAGAILSSTIEITYPLFIVGIALVMGWDRGLTPHKLAAIGLIVAGVVILSAGPAPEAEPAPQAGAQSDDTELAADLRATGPNFS